MGPGAAGVGEAFEDLGAGAGGVFLFCCYAGLRYFVGSLVQMDATVGQGSTGRVPMRAPSLLGSEGWKFRVNDLRPPHSRDRIITLHRWAPNPPLDYRPVDGQTCLLI